MNLISHSIFWLRRRQLAAAVQSLARVEREAGEAAAGLRVRILELRVKVLDFQHRRGCVPEISAADVARRAERALKRRLLA